MDGRNSVEIGFGKGGKEMEVAGRLGGSRIDHATDCGEILIIKGKPKLEGDVRESSLDGYVQDVMHGWCSHQHWGAKHEDRGTRHR